MTYRVALGVQLFDGFSMTRDGKFRLSVFLLTFLTYTAYHLSRKPLSVVKNALFDKAACGNYTTKPTNVSCGWGPFDDPATSKELLGTLDTAYWFPYAIGMFVSGFLAERIYVRYFLSFGMIMAGIMTILFGMAYFWDIHDISFYIVMQVFGGLFQSTGWPAVLPCMGNWFGKSKRGLIMTIWNWHTSTGNILGTLIPSVWVEGAWGWCFVVPGVIIVVSGVIIFCFLVPHPEDVNCAVPIHESAEEEQDEDERTGEHSALMKPSQAAFKAHENQQAISVWGALQVPGVVEYSLCLFFCKLVSYTFLTWLPNYIENTTALGAQLSAQVSIFFDLGGMVGGVAIGLLSDKLNMRGVPSLIDLCLTIPVLFLYESLQLQDLGSNVAMLLLVGFLVNGPYALITTAVAADLGTHKRLRGNAKALATVSAIIDGMGSVGAAIGPFLTGLIASTPGGWANVFYMLMIADGLAMLLLVRIIWAEFTACRRARRW